MGEGPVAAGLGAVSVAPVVAYGHCSGPIRVNCVVDGDTLWSGGVKIRVADIDTPEVGRPRCAAEKALGDRATSRMIELVNAGPFRMRAWPGRDEDRYGRKLRVLMRDGRSLGDTLVAEGLARPWTGRRQPWC
ncbi:thermonuclease family protein [Breoghania sp. L-A4]|nr:thermonuclease family protein [Breoghania sp. L-A4]